MNVHEHQEEYADYELVLGVDFGRTSIGYAFSLKSDPQDIRVNRKWVGYYGQETYRCPNVVLLDGDQNFCSFGYQAQKDYSELEDGLDQTYHLFDFLRFDLNSKMRITKHDVLTASNCKKMPTIKVFAECLRYMKNQFLEEMKDSEISIKEEQIRYVISVPAVWSFKARSIMREAAFEAQLINDRFSKKLVLVLDPECAWSYCRHLDINQFAEVIRHRNLEMLPGDRYIILKAGGVMSYVSIYEAKAEAANKELRCTTEGAYGGNILNDYFFKLLGYILTKEFIRHFMTEYPSILLHMQINVDHQKHSCRTVNKNSTQLQIPYLLGTSFQEYTDESLHSAFKRDRESETDITSGMINDAVRGNVITLLNVLEDLKKREGSMFIKPKYVFMTGGFSDSHMLQTAIISMFGKGSEWEMDVMIPQEVCLAVVYGAVRFGHDPSVINRTERRSNFCYGVQVRKDFMHGIHNNKNMKELNGKKFVNIFEVKVKRNDPLTAVTIDRLKPTFSEQSSVNIELFYSNNSADGRIRYTDDDDVFHLADINVPWNGTGMDREIEVILELGGTELIVRSVTQPGNLSIKYFVDLLHEQDILTTSQKEDQRCVVD